MRGLTRAGMMTVVLWTSLLAQHGQPTPTRVADAGSSADSSDWRRGGSAVCYEIFVRSFYDSDGDGIGDLNGLVQKLDYINDGNPRTQHDLGMRCIWLMPIVAAASYHGYDATNYYRVNPEYGTNQDFKRLVAAAHQRGIRVLIDMVLNHVSSDHPTFKDALLNPRSRYRDWFRWSPTKPDQKGPWGQEVWHKSPVREEYYYGVFYEGMPDLNYANSAVREEAKKIARFWLKEMRVDGFRLDAIPFLIEDGDRLAGSAGTHALLHEYATYVHQIAPKAFTIGEVYDSTGTMLTYYPDQLDAHFAFEASDAIIDAVRTGRAKNLLDKYLRLQRALPGSRWSPFLRNHDQPRTMTELAGNVPEAKLAATLLLTLPGLPFIYYGEEIGMTGNKPDPRLRTPMHWSRGTAAGFTSGMPWEPLQTDSLTANVDVEDRDATSLLNLYRRLIRLRASNAAVGMGELVPLDANNDAVVAYIRRRGNQAVLVIANLGAVPVSDIALSSQGRVLSSGLYTPRVLLGAAAAVTASLAVDSDGIIRDYVPVRSLPPFETRVLQLVGASR